MILLETGSSGSTKRLKELQEMHLFFGVNYKRSVNFETPFLFFVCLFLTRIQLNQFFHAVILNCGASILAY